MSWLPNERCLIGELAASETAGEVGSNEEGAVLADAALRQLEMVSSPVQGNEKSFS